MQNRESLMTPPQIQKKRDVNRVWMREWARENPVKVLQRRKRQYLRRRNDPDLWADELRRLRELRQSRIKERRLYESEYRRKNREKLAEYTRKYRKGNVQWIIANRLRTRVRLALKAKNTEKYLKTIELVGCSVSELKNLLEKQFREGMTWNNIHIDHKRPLASFDLTKITEQQQAFHYTNLQPLFAQENLIKGSKIV